MSAAAVNNEDTNTLMFCASCGTAGGDDVKLKNCTACYLVKYCSVNCQRQHRPQHKKECKKRAAEIKDEILFKQPESSYLGDCPICLLPIPSATSLDGVKFTTMSCCCKVVCDGCSYVNDMREMGARLTPSCPFCRHPVPSTSEEGYLNVMKRVEANDPVALHELGMRHNREGDFVTTIKYCEKAAGLGNIDSHYHLSCMYGGGLGVEKDSKKFMYHTEQAAIGGHVLARHNLGSREMAKGNNDRAVKHYIIAANLGCDLSMKALKTCYSEGVVSKEEFAGVLRAYP